MIIQQGQNLMDVAIQYGGDATALFDLALLNGISPTAELPAGIILQEPPPINAQVAAYFKNKNIVIATNNDAATFNKRRGIGWWKIGVDFKIA